MEDSLIGTSIRDIGKNVSKLSRQNKKLEKYLKNLGSASDTPQYRDNIRKEIHSTRTLVTFLLSAIRELPSQDSREVQRLEQEFLEKYETLKSLAQSIRKKMETTKTNHIESNAADSLTNPFLSSNTNQKTYDLSHVNIDNEQIQYENHPQIPMEEQEEAVPQSQAFIPQFDKHLEELELREEAMHVMADDLVQLNEMYQDLHGLVQEQGDQINTLGDTIQVARDEVHSGAIHLDGAAQYQRKYRKKMCFIMFILLAMAVILALTIYLSSSGN